MSTRVTESCVVSAPVDTVWRIIRRLDFGFWDAVQNAEVDGKDDPGKVGGTRTVTFKDKTVQKIRVLELSDVNRSIGWELYESKPASGCLSTSHVIQLFRVTKTEETFIEWTTYHSSDADGAVIADAKYKRREAFKDLKRACVGAIPPKQCQALFDLFKARVKHDGVIDRKEFEILMTETTQSVKTSAHFIHSKDFINKVFDLFDKDHNGKVDMHEFFITLTFLSASQGGDEGRNRMKFAFQILDADNDGFIDQKEMANFVKCFVKVSKPANLIADMLGSESQEVIGLLGEAFKKHDKTSSSAVEAIFKAADLNKDGKISFEEFCKVVKVESDNPEVKNLKNLAEFINTFVAATASAGS